MIRVAIDGACWWNDRGFGRFTRELVGALHRRDTGFAHHLVLPHPRPPGCDVPDPPAGLQITVARPDAPSRRESEARAPGRIVAMARALAAPCDVVFFPSLSTWVPTRGPSVVTVHDAIPERHPRHVFAHRGQALAWSLKSAAARRSASRLLTVSTAAAADLVRLLGEDPARIDVTTEGADPRFQPRAADRAATLARCGLPDGPFFLYVGGFTPHKNTLTLLEAFALVPGAPRLVLAGATSRSGFHDELPAIEGWLAARPEVAARVALPGWLADDGLVDLYNTATALVIVSLAEGFGLPAVEAMSCGCPVIASDRTSLPEVVGGGGLLVDPTDAGAIAGAMHQLLRDPRRRAELSQQALTEAARFSWDAAAAGAEASLRAAVGR